MDCYVPSLVSHTYYKSTSMSFVGDIVSRPLEACRILLVITRMLNLSYFTCFTAVILVWDDIPSTFRSFYPVSGHQKNMFPHGNIGGL